MFLTRQSWAWVGACVIIGAGCKAAPPPEKPSIEPVNIDDLEKRLENRFRESILEKALRYSSDEKSKGEKNSSMNEEIIQRLKLNGSLSTADWRNLLLNRLRLVEPINVSAYEFTERYGLSNLTRQEQEGMLKYNFRFDIIDTKHHPWHESEVIKLLGKFKYSKRDNRISFKEAALTLSDPIDLTCVLDSMGNVYDLEFGCNCNLFLHSPVRPPSREISHLSTQITQLYPRIIL